MKLASWATARTFSFSASLFAGSRATRESQDFDPFIAEPASPLPLRTHPLLPTSRKSLSCCCCLPFLEQNKASSKNRACTSCQPCICMSESFKNCNGNLCLPLLMPALRRPETACALQPCLCVPAFLLPPLPCLSFALPCLSFALPCLPKRNKSW